jgi:hypothetical protein
MKLKNIKTRNKAEKYGGIGENQKERPKQNIRKVKRK